MPTTQLRGTNILDGSVQRQDLDVTTPGSAVIRKVIPGSGVTFTSTGVDAGTGDVTINASGGSSLGFQPQVDLTNASADYTLLNGQTAFRDFTSVSSISLFTACSPDQTYVVRLVLNRTSGIDLGSNPNLQINNADFGSSVCFPQRLDGVNTSAIGDNFGATAKPNFVIAPLSKIDYAEITINTKTAGKTVKCEYICAGATQSVSGVITNFCTDTTTVITSLGKINLFTPQSGRVYITKIADSNAAGSTGAGIVAGMPPQVDLTNASTDQVLANGQTGFRDFTSATSVPLFTVCGDNQIFSVQLALDIPVSAGAASASTQLLPNNAALGSALIQRLQVSAIAAPTANPGAAVNNETTFILDAGGNCHNVQLTCRTRTKGKGVSCTAKSVNNAPSQSMVVQEFTWLDTTTVWNSLGTITFGTATTGRVYITKIADANAGGSVTNVGGITYDPTTGLIIPGALILNNDITPPQLTADVDNYNPTGNATAYELRLTSNNTWNINGLAGGVDGLMKKINNVGNQQITIQAEALSSTAANRFDFSIPIVPSGSVTVRYDATVGRWDLDSVTGSEPLAMAYSQVLNTSGMPFF